MNRETKVALIEDMARVMEACMELNMRVIEAVSAEGEGFRNQPQAAFQKPQKEIMSVDEAAEYCGYSKGYIYKLVSLMEIPCHKPTGKRLFFKRSELDDFASRGKQYTNYELRDKAAEIINGGTEPRGRRRSLVRKNTAGRRA
jgi:excisionase family DNA binding protein